MRPLVCTISEYTYKMGKNNKNVHAPIPDITNASLNLPSFLDTTPDLSRT